MKSPNDTGTVTGRDDSNNEVDGAADAFKPTEDWIKQYTKQCDRKLIAGLNQYARTRGLAINRAGAKFDDLDVRGLVLDALGDTWLGVVRWDPSKCSLGYHIVRTIEGRSDKLRQRAEQMPHLSIGDRTEDSREAERDASELVVDHEQALKRMVAGNTMAQVRALAVRDKPILRMLDAYDAGCDTKDAVLAHAKMTSRVYHNAYIRLKRIIRHIKDNQLAKKARA
jgi:hypothetical protein